MPAAGSVEPGMPHLLKKALFAGLALSALCSCVDLSALKGKAGQFSESPVSNPRVDAVVGEDAPAPFLPDLLELPEGLDLAGLPEFSLVSLEPTEGSYKGGDLVMLVGSGFHDDMEVFFGQAKAPGLFVVDENFLTVITPFNLPGWTDVSVVGGEGQKVVLEEAFFYFAALNLHSVSPDSGPAPGGTPIVVEGEGFGPACNLFIGNRQALFVNVDDSFRIEAVTPPGSCGPVDVRVVCDGEKGTLKDAFSYGGAPEILNAEPSVGLAAGGYWITLHGKNFTPGTVVQVGDQMAETTHFISADRVDVLLPEAEAGLVGFTASNECGDVAAEDLFLYLDPGHPSGFKPKIVGYLPQSLPACAGGYVTIGIENMGDPDKLEVFFGKNEAEIVSLDEELGVIDVRLDPAEPSVTDLLVYAEGGISVVGSGFEFLDQLVVSAVTPVTGPSEGGSLVTLEGCPFGDQPEVRFGPTVAPEVEVLSPYELRAVTPSGSPGPVDVSVFSAGQLATLPHGYSYVTAEPELYFLDPDNGARSGGTYVRFVGAGLSPSAKYFIGEEECFNVEHISSSLATMRVPPNDVGTYDASAQWPGSSVALAEAFTYYDPRSKKGGTWGGPIDESLNVTVTDSSTGKGLAGALVTVGDDPETPHQGFTDENGQITFSEPGFEGKQTITAAKATYSLYSVVHFDATNVTVYLSPIVYPEGGSSYKPARAYVSGKVIGLDKYVVAPPGNCANKQVEGILCTPCLDDDGCALPPPEPPVEGEEDEEPVVAYCAQIGDTGKFCVTECLAPEDCPEGFTCGKVGLDRVACVPRRGEPHIECISSKKSMFGSPPNPGPGGSLNQHEIYFISTVIGELAVVCYGGYTDYDTGIFFPTVMGLKRHIIALKNEVVADQDVHLAIPLSRKARLAFHDLPYHPEGIRKPYQMVSIELGKDGYLSLPKAPEWVEDGAYFSIFPLPEKFIGPLEGATYSVYASVQSDTGIGLPYSVRMVTDVENLLGDGILLHAEAGQERLFPPVDGDIVGLAYRSSSDLYVGTSEGELIHWDGIGWTPAGLAGAGDGFTVLEEDNLGGLWLGGQNGKVWHFNGSGWTVVEDETGFGPVVGIWAAMGEAFVAYSDRLVRIVDDVAVKVSDAPGEFSIQAVWGSDLEDIWILTDGGAVWNYGPSGWVQLTQYASWDFVAVDGTGPDDIWLAGNPPMVLHYEGGSYEIFVPEGTGELTSIVSPAPGKVFVVGEDGSFYAYEEGAGFVTVDTGTLQDFTSLDYSYEDGTVAVAGIQAYNLGPFMAYPRPLLPEKDEVFDFKTLKWDFWTEGAVADFHFIMLSNAEGFPFWTMMVDGAVTEVALPPIVQQLGANVIPDGKKRMNLTSSLNPIFDIDYYNNSDLSIYDKVSWAVELTSFY